MTPIVPALIIGMKKREPSFKQKCLIGTLVAALAALFIVFYNQPY